MSPSPSLAPPRGGREEIRALALRPALLHLHDAKGPEAVSELLAAAGLQESEVAHDSAWVSLACARKILEEISGELGEAAIASRGAHATSPEVLGPYMRLLRQASSPSEGYQFLVSTSSESLRIGSYSLLDLKEDHARVVYTPLEEIEADQEHRSLCLLRQAEFKAVPQLWGLAEATLTETSCIARGDLTCSYELSWGKISPRLARWTALAAGACAGAVGAYFGGAMLAPVVAASGAVLGTMAGLLVDRSKESQAARTRERHRIIALEHSLEQRGQLQYTAADLTHSVLGGKYRILRSVGSGGIGTVYAAEHLGVGFQVAVKVLRGAAAVDASEVARLRREARIQMSLEHPNIIRTFDLDQLPDGTLYVVMELLRGLSLQDQLRKQSPLTPGFLLPVFLQACRGLSAAHRLGIVHRDLKPGNIFLCEGGVVKVLDFGMSKLAQEDALTQDGYTLGTPEYMSPEQCVGGPIDARSDIYAFGVLMYESLTGELPFRSKNRRALLDHHQRTPPRSMRRARPDLDLPEGLDEIVLACLEKKPEDRPESAEQLERRLALLPPTLINSTRPIDTPRQKSSERPGSGVER